MITEKIKIYSRHLTGYYYPPIRIIKKLLLFNLAAFAFLLTSAQTTSTPIPKDTSYNVAREYAKIQNANRRLRVS